MKKQPTQHLTLKSVGMFIAVAGVSLIIFSSCAGQNNNTTRGTVNQDDVTQNNIADTDAEIEEIKQGSDEEEKIELTKEDMTEASAKKKPVAASEYDISPETLAALDAKRETIRKWAPTCADGSQTHGICPEWDMTLFSGIACLAGETARCDEVRRSQGPDGRWWRAPELVGDDTKQNTFSRDMARGALAYLVATKDVEAAKRWQAYIESNKGKMCNTKNTTNNRCTITAGTSRLFGPVWEYLGLKPAKWMNRGKFISKIYDPIEAMIQPDNFPMHLNAVFAWVQLEIERRGGPKAEKINKKVVKIITRREPNNPFFLILRDGPTKEVADIILNHCPDTKPNTLRFDWAWQRSQKLKKGDTEYVWQHASGHDCIFMINVFERERALRMGAAPISSPSEEAIDPRL